jgi:type I restriction-modification system DNA methylase subunit
MSELLSQLRLSRDTPCDGLVAVSDNPPNNISLSEQRIIRDVYKISNQIDYIFFRRFNGNEIITSQPVAYVIENDSGKLTEKDLSRLHHTLWLNGTIPLLYVDHQDRVDILGCMSGPVSNKVSDWKYQPLESIFSMAKNIDEQVKKFSADRLSDGTFWDSEKNKVFVDIKRSAHNVLIEKVKWADRKIDGKNNAVSRRLLLLTLLVKYLEDRGVFNYEPNFFKTYYETATSFYDVIKNAAVDEVEKLFKDLEKKFNGDIFALVRNKDESITIETIQKVAEVVRVDSDETGQLYFWNIYNFEHIPVEVLSHIYQYFADKENGAVFTPILLVNLMLDQVMPLEQIRGNEKIFDPTCGSGIFLVSAFRRLIYIKEMENGSKRLAPQRLIQLLKETIFGVEFQEEAAYISGFSLALAVCDALRPDIIWNDLRFERLVDHNIFIGDFGLRGKDALNASGSAGFDIILGNPPFKSALTDPIRLNIIQNNWHNPPGNQLAYYILMASIKQYLADSGKLCMIQHYGFLYNSQAAKMRSEFFNDYTVDKILDFISISGLFHGVNTKAIAVQVQKIKPINKHIIQHLTFRRTIAVQERIYFELDYYDYNYVSQEYAVDERFTWKADLLGGGRLNKLVMNFNKLPTIQQFIDSKNWYAGVGLKIGRTSKDTKQADWLYNKPLLTSDALCGNEINKQFLKRVDTNKIREPKSKMAFLPPLMILSQVDSLDAGLWNEGFLAYTHEFVGIKTSESEKAELERFFHSFVANKSILQGFLYLLGYRTLAGRSTATYKQDIMALPWPKNSDFELAPWEKESLADVRDYMAEYVRLGQDSKLLKKFATKTDLENYSNTFLRIIRNAYPSMTLMKKLESDNLILISFSFSDKEDSLPILNDPHWADELQSLMEKEQGYSLRTKRVVRIFTGNTVMIIKPDKLRYWIRSTAIRDVDDILTEILRWRGKDVPSV